MKDARLNRAKAVCWLLAALAAGCATFWHFRRHGSFIWALTDIPFVVLLIVAFLETIRRPMPANPSDDR